MAGSRAAHFQAGWRVAADFCDIHVDRPLAGYFALSPAVHLAQRVSPQLVLVDVVLGEEDGIRCARRIKAVSPQSRVVMISAYPDREFHRLSLEAGAVAFLDKKDLDAVTLRQVVEDVNR